MQKEYPLWSFNELVEVIYTRPRMFVHDEDFLQLASYVNGYMAGRGSEHYYELREFQQWIAEKYYAQNKINSRAMAWQYCILSGTAPGASPLETFYQEYLSFRATDGG